MALGDLNGDGSLDIFSIGALGGVVRQNDGHARFSDTGFNSDFVTGIALGDIDGDGQLDAFKSHTELGLFWQRNVGGGTFGAISVITPESPPISDYSGNVVFQESNAYFDCALADVDGDGDLDVLAMAHGPTFEVWRNDGRGEFSYLSAVYLEVPGYSIASGDLNGDGAVDALIVGSNQSLEVLLNDSQGHFTSQVTEGLTFSPSQSVLADLDADGDLDALVVSRDGNDFIFWNNGDGTFATEGERISDRRASIAAVGDLNNDGRLDIVIGGAFNDDGTPAGQVEILLNSMATVIALPSAAGRFEVIRDADDVVVRRAQGEEVFRGALEELRGLDLVGTAADEAVIVDFSNGNPLPLGGLGFRAGGPNDRDSLRFTGLAANRVEHVVGDSRPGVIRIDGRQVLYSGVESFRDELIANERVFEFGDGGDIVNLTDDSMPNDGTSRLSVASGFTIDFASSDALTLRGGSGNDQLRVFGRDATLTAGIFLSGGDGNDVLVGSIGPDTLEGGNGNDTLLGGAGDDVLRGGAGADLIKGGNGRDTLTGDAGADSILAGAGQDSVNGGDGDDTLRGEGGSFDSLTGGPGNDLLDGGSGADVLIESGDVNFTLTAYKLVGLGTDRFVSISMVQLSGGVSANVLDASTWFGPVTLSGGDGDDTLKGSRVADELRGDAGNDVLVGNQGHDTLYGQIGRDLLIGSAGNDMLIGGADDDVLLGDAGQDSLFGDEGKDILLGGDGNDQLDGGVDDDTLAGNAGQDQLLALPSEINERFNYRRLRI